MNRVKKGILHRTTLLLSSGWLLVSILYGSGKYIEPDQFRYLSYGFLLIWPLVQFFIIIILNYVSFTRQWPREKWGQYSIIYYGIPGGFAFSYMIAASGKYAFVCIGVLIAGQLVWNGIRSRHHTLLLTVPVLAGVVFFQLLFHGANLSTLATTISLAAVLIFANTMLGITSGFSHAQLLKIQNYVREIRQDKRTIKSEKDKSERLLLNILPQSVADELKTHGKTTPVHYESATVMFTDFKGFTKIAETLTPIALVEELDGCFSYFDSIITKYNLEKLKTIGDSYMCVGGVPNQNQTHAIDMVLAALEIQTFMNQAKDLKSAKNLEYWELRLGIHSGPLVAGVIGQKKFAFDVWSDTVNTASRCESSGLPGAVNISEATYNLVADFFECEYRGAIEAKNKGPIKMYFVSKIRRHLSADSQGRIPGEHFNKMYNDRAKASE